jgi:hypothetical protein
MEHVGAILYNASSLLLDPSATQNQMLQRASTISHETAHMWFGDLVTMRWFNDVWMKETLANFMAARIVNPSFPQINHDLRFPLSYHPQAYDVERTQAPTPLARNCPISTKPAHSMARSPMKKRPSSCVSSKPSSVRIPSARACASIYGATHSPMPPGSIW